MNVQTTEVLRKSVLGLLVTAGAFNAHDAWSQSPSGGLQRDPVTGDIYRTVTHRITRPVVDERIERQEKVVYRPQTVKETRPEVKTTYLPVTEVKWVPYVQNRWNLFRQPSVAYRQIPQTHWERRSDVVNRTTTQTQWVAEKQTVEIPHRTVRYETTEQTGVELVARGRPQPSVGSNIAPEIAARLQPMPPPGSVSVSSTTAIASNTIGLNSSDAPIRNSAQRGMRTNVLMPSTSPASTLQPTSGVGIATVPNLSIYR